MTDLKPGVALLAKAMAKAAPLKAPTLPLTLGGREVLLTFGEWREPYDLRHGFAIGDQVAVLDLPRATLDWLLPACPDDPVQRGMLLELACLDLLDRLDAQATDAETPPVAFGVEVATADGPLHLSLHLTQPLADALNDHLGRNAEPPDVAQIAVPVRLRLGQQFLTEPEAGSLTEGDIVMLESGPAMLIAADGFAAAVEITPNGPMMLSDLLPLPATPPQRGHVRFDAAQTTMTLAELNVLANGQPLPLAVFDGAVDMLIDGRLEGRGEPITIGTDKGIRITHLAGPAA